MSNVNLTNGIPETNLPPESNAVLAKLEEDINRDSLMELVKLDPTSLIVWAHLGKNGRDTIESYAAYRVGYHRGLDKLRKNGWRGSGFVRWAHEPNQGFIKCLNGLRLAAKEIGELEEFQRCTDFIKQLDPDLDIDTIDD